MTMTGYSEIYGAYQTKADKKADLIAKAKKMNEMMDSYEDPSFHGYQACFEEYCRIESILITKYGMDEDEVATATCC